MKRLVIPAILLVCARARADEPATPEPVPAPTPEPAPKKPIEPTEPREPAPTPVVTSPAVVLRMPAFAPWSRARLELELELYAQGRWTSRAGEDLTDFRLDRGEVGARIGLGEGARGLGHSAAAELRVEAIRSGVAGGSLGIDGDSTVIRVKRAMVIGQYVLGLRPGDNGAEQFLVVDGALGFVPDPWIATLEDGYTVKALSRSGSERMLGWPTSDLSALGRLRIGPARLAIAVGNGEGLQFPERNTGKTTTAVLEVVPYRTPDAHISLAAVARDGSIGVASIRDRRVGGGATLVTPWLRAGGEVVRAYGLGDRGDLQGTLLSGWADGRVIEHAFVSLRGATLGFDGGGRTSTFGGAVAVEPWHEARSSGRFRLWLAIDRITSSGAAMPLPGADPGDATLVMLIASATAPLILD